ncbi:MAG: hypothetical protein ACLFP4_13140 [Spirochaetales bacterium]
MPIIGGLNETELHEQLKHHYAGAGGQVEQEVDGFVVDVVGRDELVEIQTRGVGKLRRKILALTESHAIRVVIPVAAETHLIKRSITGELISSRKSPKRGRLESAFREVASIADLLPRLNLTIEVVLVTAVETRVDDGKGSWRRHGVSIEARALGQILERHEFRTCADYISLLPSALPSPFTNRDLCDTAGLRYAEAQPVTSTLRKMGALRLSGKRGRELLYEVVT